MKVYLILIISLVSALALQGPLEKSYFQRLTQNMSTQLVSESKYFEKTPGTPNCTEKFFMNQVDHYNFQNDKQYLQRYFICDQYYKPDGSIFFYTGNEADVELYVNSTGLMWENAEQFNALIVFAEHRYWGKSWPDHSENSQFLSLEQALADYANFIYSLKQNISEFNTPVIAFGGSYGGMLSSWMRIKYPHLIDGSIAASAPILAFLGQGNNFYDNGGNDYWQVVTADASEKKGANPNCTSYVRKAFDDLLKFGQSENGREYLQDKFKTCEPIQNYERDVRYLALNLALAWDTLAMGNFPFKSNYLTGNPEVFLPPFPVRLACEKSVNEEDSLDGLREGSNVYYNASGELKCFKINFDQQLDGMWGKLWCSEMLDQETYFTMTGKSDMFYDKPFNLSFINERCEKQFNIKPKQDWIRTTYGSKQDFFRKQQASNILFSNGLLDPWSTGGFRESPDQSLPVVIIEEGAHHIDLMFSNKDDPKNLTDSRVIEVQWIKKWIDEAKGLRIELSKKFLTK